MNLIAAVDKNWAIGRNNKLLVSIPDDMKFFRETTTGKVVVMGRKTLESFPGKKPLKNRVNIVLTGETVVFTIIGKLDQPSCIHISTINLFSDADSFFCQQRIYLWIIRHFDQFRKLFPG